ncbi:recombinase family protein [Brevundimonas sp. 2R-24]|uniref:Recombinase family protein n=1 Tax=Peiella sedimenti TaxID=3061083 RepID=A0ABT8SLR7_9CAUL|nr:recombinase family protein [Caulobacteraceae bacterium XZ-24]
MSLFNRGPVPPPGSRVLLYARFSDNQQNPLGAEDQLRILAEDCQRHGWVVVGSYTDKGKSGRSVKRRTGYLDMMAAAAAGEADVIGVFQLDRLGRDARELNDARNRLQDANVMIFTHDKGFMTRFEFAIYAEMAQMESERMAERTSRGRRAAAARGKFMGDVPYGYRLVEQKAADGSPILNSRGHPVRDIAVNDATAPYVLRVNQDFDAGLSPHQIAVALTAEGIPTPEGGPIWHPNTIVGVKRSMSGLLRNPIIVGRVIHGKVTNERDPKTGELKKRKGDVADMIEHERPDLRIVPQDVWDRNQARLAARPASKLVDRRRPTYPFSGLVKCGVCGGSFVQVSKTMGCSAYRLKACSNNRRVRRQDLEKAALDGLTQQLAQPEVISWFMPEYLRERGPANEAAAERRARAVQKLAEINEEIDSIREQLRLKPGVHARKMFNDDLETLIASKAQFEREAARTENARPVELTSDFVVGRFEALLEDLGQAIQGNERDAARAREIVRSLITKVTVEPFDGEGGRPDGKGNKAVRVYIEGEISRLVDRVTLEKKIMHERGAGDVHNLPIATFWFYVDLFQPQTPEEEQLWRDVALIGRMLDDADWPILFREMVAAVNDRGREPDEAELESDQARVRLGLAQYRRGKWVRSIRLSDANDWGWVWADRPLKDHEWRVRHKRRTASGPTAVGDAETGVTVAAPLGVIRLGGPEAAVMQIRRSTPTTEE